MGHRRIADHGVMMMVLVSVDVADGDDDDDEKGDDDDDDLSHDVGDGQIADHDLLPLNELVGCRGRGRRPRQVVLERVML